MTYFNRLQNWVCRECDEPTRNDDLCDKCQNDTTDMFGIGNEGVKKEEETITFHEDR